MLYLLIVLESILKIIGIVLPLLIGVAYLTLLERKLMGGIQQRRGPVLVGVLGLLQPLADGAKLLLKESIFPRSANLWIFTLAPILTFMLAIAAWAVIPIGYGMVLADIDLGLLYIMGISGIGVYGVLTAGWASNTKYAFLGSLRSAAQMISYEVSLGLILMSVILCAQSLNFTQIVEAQQRIWYVFPLAPLAVLFFISALAETNRSPFDLPEAEAELVSGFNVEYSAMAFALFFLGEYGNMILMSSLATIFFLGGWLSPFAFLPSIIPGPIWFGIKTTIFLILFVWVRSSFPRYRYDQLMRLGWKVFLPLSLAWIFFTAGFLSIF